MEKEKIKQEGKEKNVRRRKMTAMTIKPHEGDMLQMALGSDFYFPVFRHGLIQAVTHNISHQTLSTYSQKCSFCKVNLPFFIYQVFYCMKEGSFVACGKTHTHTKH